MESKLYLSDTNKKIGGVCGGLGEYFGVDPTLIRLIWILLIFLAGTGLIAYFIAWIIIPQRPKF
jgi:phage shock protein C